MFVPNVRILAACMSFTGLALSAPLATASDGSATLETLAGSYLSYVQASKAAAQEAPRSSDAIAQAIDRSAQVANVDAVNGVMALGILTASQDSQFKAGLATASTLMGKEQLVERLKSDISFASRIGGADAASRTAARVIGHGLAQVDASAAILGASAYSLQKFAWANQHVDPAVRLAAHAVARNTPVNLVQYSPVSGADGVAETPAPALSIGDTLLTNAALHALGEPLLTPTVAQSVSSSGCIRRANLNMRQCIAAAAFPFEQTFCLSKHGYEETNACMKAATR